MALRDLAIAIQPLVPSKSAALLDQLGIPLDERGFRDLEDDEWFHRLVERGFRVEKPTPIFPRLELPQTVEVK
jgi:methionyl-tRNA synthetase